MDIENMNSRIISCRMLSKDLSQEYNTTQPVMHPEVLDAVIEHRKFWGLTTKFRILRQLAKTRKFTKIVCT